MKRTAFLAMMSTFLLLMAISVQGQANSGQLDTFGNYANSPNPADQLSGIQNQVYTGSEFIYEATQVCRRTLDILLRFLPGPRRPQLPAARIAWASRYQQNPHLLQHPMYLHPEP